MYSSEQSSEVFEFPILTNRSRVWPLYTLKYHRNRRNQALFQYLRDKKERKKEGGSEKGGGVKNLPISPPLDPRLPRAQFFLIRTDLSR